MRQIEEYYRFMADPQKLLVEISFEDFNAFDILVNAELARCAIDMQRYGPTPQRVVWQQRLRRIQETISRMRPPGYLDKVRADYERAQSAA